MWIFSKPFARFGLFPVGGRSTAVRLESGDVWVLASTPLNEETKSKLKEIGPVKSVVQTHFVDMVDIDDPLSRYICGPDAVHHLFLAEYKREYPDAKLIGVAALVAKRKELKFDGGEFDLGSLYIKLLPCI